MQQHAKQKSDEKTSSKSMAEKVNGSSKKDDHDVSKERDKSNKYRTLDTKPPSPLDAPPPSKISTPTESKKAHDKDERKHKHKKKDKNKDKDRKKSKSKDISDSSPMSTSSNRKHSNSRTPTTATQTSGRGSNAKTNAIPPTSSQSTQLTDKSVSSDFDDEDYMDRPSPKPDKVSSSNDTNQSISDHLIDPIAERRTPRSNQTDSPKKHADKSSGKKTKEPKSNQSSASKDEKKKKRKSKTEKQKHDDSGGGGGGSSGASSGKRKTQSPIGSDEPPPKFYKKEDDKIPKIKDEHQLDSTKLLPGRTPPVPHLIASPSTQKLYHQSPDSSKQANLKRSADNVINNQSKLAHISPPTSSSSSSSSDDDDDETTPSSAPQQQLPPPQQPPSNQSSQHGESPADKQYIAQLKELQNKIMTLENNDELQQVVEMIAATGCYEVTNQTFDFDLCALDRTTVRRLQERLG